MFKRTFVFLLLAVLLLPLAVGAQDDDGYRWALDPDVANIAVAHGEAGEWDFPYTDPGAVLYHDGQFHMFRNGFQGWPAPVDVDYWVSDDGLTWEAVTDGPMILADDAPFDATAVLASSALVDDDGTWVLYMYSWPRIGGPDAGSIVRATAPAPTGPWTYDESPLLVVGDAGAWDAQQLTVPAVIRTDDEYLLYYSALDADFNWAIGVATSTDGITFEKHPDPVLTAADLLPFERAQVHQPRVVQTPDGIVLMYRAYDGQQRNVAFGFAISEDGRAFTHLQDTALFTDSDAARRGMWFTALAYADGTYYGYFEINFNYQNQTDIYVGTVEGPLTVR